MFASFLALAVVSQIAADGLTVTAQVPNDLATWRWVKQNDKALLGWGRLNEQSQFVPADDPPEPPLHPLVKPAPECRHETPGDSLFGDMPAFATNGVVAEKIEARGLTLRASDPITAASAKDVLHDAEHPAEGRTKPPKIGPKLFPDPTEYVPYAVAFGLFAVAGVVVIVRSLQSR